MSIKEKKERFVKICRRVYDRGLTGATGGNVSERIENNKIFIKPTGFCLGDITFEDVVTTDLRGKVLECKEGLSPSSELPMHTMIYEELPEAKGIIHAHAKVSCGYAVAGISISPDYWGAGKITIPCLPEVKPGTKELGESIIKALNEKTEFMNQPTEYINIFKDWGMVGFLLGHHGLVSISKTLDGAYYFAELIEECATVDVINRFLKFISGSKT